MTKRKTPWVVIVAQGVSKDEPRAHGLCQRCGERVVMPFPMRIPTFIGLSNGFTKAHELCEAKP